MTGEGSIILGQVDPRAAVIHEVVRMADDLDPMVLGFDEGDFVLHISAVNDVAAEFTRQTEIAGPDGTPIKVDVKDLYTLVPAKLVIALAED